MGGGNTTAKCRLLAFFIKDHQLLTSKRTAVHQYISFIFSIYFHISYILSIHFPPIFHQKSPATHNQACYSPSKYILRIYHIRRGFFVGYFEILRPMDCTLDKIPWEVAFAGQNVLLQEISVPKSINSYSVDSKCISSSTFFAHFTCVDYLMKLSILHDGKSFMEFSWQFCLKYCRLAQNCSHIFRDKPL